MAVVMPGKCSTHDGHYDQQLGPPWATTAVATAIATTPAAALAVSSRRFVCICFCTLALLAHIALPESRHWHGEHLAGRAFRVCLCNVKNYEPANPAKLHPGLRQRSAQSSGRKEVLL